jgi:hypothetical protein
VGLETRKDYGADSVMASFFSFFATRFHGHFPSLV